MRSSGAAIALGIVLAPRIAAGEPDEQDEDYAQTQTVDVRGSSWSSPRGIGDVRIRRDRLEASPRQTAPEMLSAAPGFFVDHEDGEGFANDVYVRGFDLEHGSGIEMRLGSIPINNSIHVHGQGYADAGFIIPEVVRSIRVLAGTYDPRQGDAAIVGSAYFDLGVPERGYQLRSSYGSFGQGRVVAIAAPRDLDDETFLAFAVRKTDGFGASRDGQSGSVNAQYGIDVGDRDHVRLVATAYGARSSSPGVVRQDDVEAGRVGYYAAYPYFAQNQGVESARVLCGADFDHVAASGTRIEIAPWVTMTDFRSRQNFTGAALGSGIGDLFEGTNRETAFGIGSRAHTAPWHVTDAIEVIAEPGVGIRAGGTDQSRSLLDPAALTAWERRLDASLTTLDAGAYVDLDVRIARRLRISGGARVDLLDVTLHDRLADEHRAFSGVAASPRITTEYALTSAITSMLSYGEGFRSLDVEGLTEGARPYAKARSVEAGVRTTAFGGRFVATVAGFETWVDDELVFEAESGGLESEDASVRRGMVASILAKPARWLLGSFAVTTVRATFDGGDARFVPGVPPVLFRADVSARGEIARIASGPVIGRIGAGYTYLAPRHLTDGIIGPATHALNAGAALRYRAVEIGVDAYNVLGLRYADDAQVYVSSWNVRSSASLATHLSAAPPATVIGTVALSF